jgi:hypothetical protein
LVLVLGFVCYSSFSADAIPLTGINRLVIPFISCGDLSGFDSDQTYSLDDGTDSRYQSLEATTSPLDPPYKFAKELRKEGKLNATLGAVVIIDDVSATNAKEKTTIASSTVASNGSG